MVIHWIALLGILLFLANCGADSTCCEKVSLYYLDAAVDLIAKAKLHFPQGGNCENKPDRNAQDCSELLEMGHKENGVYTIWPKSRVADGKPLKVYCDMETDGGGWTLMQRRGPFGGAVDYFYKDWKSYKEGFGDIEKEFWLGNDNIFALTNPLNGRNYSARFDLKRDNETRYAHYDTFWIDDEDSKYTLHIANYSGDAGDSMVVHNNQKFSTIDEDNDNHTTNCVENYRGGWWYNSCYASNLNGEYKKAGKKYYSDIRWNTWTQSDEPLQATEIKIRPRKFKLPQDSLSNTPK